MSKTYSVYTLKTLDGRVYVGVTSMHVENRWNKGNGYRFLTELWKVIQRDGWDSIVKTVVSEELSHREASVLEQELIAQFDTCDPRCGYNRELGGITDGKLVSNASREKMRKAKVGELNPNYGRHFDESHRRKLAESNEGQTRSPDTCKRIGLAKEKPVNQYTLGGSLIARWESGRKASQRTGVQTAHISKVCRGQRKTAGGYCWAFDTTK